MYKSFILSVLIIIFDSCIDRLDFKSEDEVSKAILVEGFISDQPGPYTIKLSQAISPDGNLYFKPPVPAKKVTILDTEGNAEDLSSNEIGIYKTNPSGLRGKVGREYYVRIELLDGSIFESVPDMLLPSGNIDSLYVRFESYQPATAPTQYGYRVFINSNSESGHLRWRFRGTFKAESYPQFHSINNQCRTEPDPPPCSGFTRVSGGGFLKTGDCTCCICWVSDGDAKPNLSDDKILTNGNYNQIEIAYIPFDALRFQYKKYMIKVEQMSLSNRAYEFWKIIRDQKEGYSNIFQPAIGKVGTNFISNNSTKTVVGIFYATSIKNEILFITGANPKVPYPQFDIPLVESCFFYNSCDLVYDYLSNASTMPPPEWED